MVLDASVWVSALSRADAHHAETRAWLDRSIASGRCIQAPVLVLGEVSGAIAWPYGSAEVAGRAINVLRRSPALTLVELDLTLATLSARFAARLRLRGRTRCTWRSPCARACRC